MLSEQYSLCYAEMQDIDSWIKMIGIVKDNFPGLGTVEQIDNYKRTVIKNIKRKTALCVKYEGEVVGVMIFSYNLKCLSCMAVHPNHRRKGIAPRSLYKKYGFKEYELVTVFNCPHQKFILHRE